MDIIKYYGSDETKTEFINHDSEPLMAVIAHDRSHAVVSLLDEGCEHHLLLAKALDKYNIDEYFRIIFAHFFNIHKSLVIPIFLRFFITRKIGDIFSPL